MYPRLRAEMIKRRLTVNALALELKITPDVLYKALKAQTPFYERYRKKISSYFDIDEGILFPGINEL